MPATKRSVVDRTEPLPTSDRSVAPARAHKPKRDRARSPENFKTSMLSIRLRSDLKDQAATTFENLGISLPEAVRIFLARVVRDQAFPFPFEIPNAETAAALRESRSEEPGTFATIEDLFDALEKSARR